MDKKILITSALPYVNNIPHLGNLIQVLSADVFARYCRLKGYETLYICGTDEYGTATETKALEEGITPKELCDRYYKIHADVYRWFGISFDSFGRTSAAIHTEVTQDIFKRLDENGYIKEKMIEQMYCEKCERSLADRYVHGTCPFCGFSEARGDQCENCGKLLDPVDLVAPRCSVCGTKPVIRESNHLYIDLPAILPRLQKWMDKAASEGFWARNAVRMTQAWIRDGLHERCITRDLKWGIPVPKNGFRDKVFYVWFDACIGYISITANLTSDWEKWWKNPEEARLYQFIGKDNIPFHTVIFPSSLIGTGESWTLLNHMSSTEYLNYESGKFSKSKGVGVFGTDARDTGIPADVWRFYIFYNRPEKSDAVFTWKDFQEKVNGELIGNLANLVNRTLTFVSRNYNGELSAAEPDEGFWTNIKALEKEITGALEKVEIRDAFRKIFALSSLGNKRFQDEEPWKTVRENPEKTRALLRDLVYLIRDLGLLINPYLPETAAKIHAVLGLSEMKWDRLGVLTGIEKVHHPELLFKRLEDEAIEELRNRFAGNQKRPAPERKAGELFRTRLDLRAGKIVDIEKHPRADKLYIETVDLGRETRQIVSGLVPYYKEDELKGRNIILVANLKTARLWGVESRGMLLAAEDEETIEVLFVDRAEPGDRIVLSGQEGKESDFPDEYDEIDIEEFLSIPIRVSEYRVQVERNSLMCADEPVITERVRTGKVG